jgi:hypothetical protein
MSKEFVNFSYKRTAVCKGDPFLVGVFLEENLKMAGKRKFTATLEAAGASLKRINTGKRQIYRPKY